MRKVLVLLLLVVSQKVMAQHKTDVLVFGGSASGVSAAVQAVRSGVKSILLNEQNHLLENEALKPEVPAFNLGFWKEWQDSCKKDSVHKDPRLVLENQFLKKTKGLQYLNSAKILSVKEKGKTWFVEIERNGKKEEIKAKVIVDAGFGDREVLNRFNVVHLDAEKIKPVTAFSNIQRYSPYNGQAKTYRTSIAAGYGASRDSIHYFPLGIFISKDKPTVLAANFSVALPGIKAKDLENIALWTNIGQSVGALAAYGPFFNTTADKANVRMIQGEVFTYRSFIYPVVDVQENDFSFLPIQKIIGSQILDFDFVSGKFRPDDLVNKNDIRDVLSELHPRSRIWFIEHPEVSDLKLSEVISLLSFIGGKEVYIIEGELQRNWKERFNLTSVYSTDKLITRKELSILMDIYLSPFSVRVNMDGYFIK